MLQRSLSMRQQVFALAFTGDQIMISSADIAARAPFVPITITAGVLADEAMQLFHR